MTMQIVINGLIAGLSLGLLAIGFSLIYSTARILHIAHAATYLVGAYVGVMLVRYCGAPQVVAGIGASLAGVALGLIIEVCVYRPLRRLSSPPLIFFLSSLAVVVVIQNLIGLIVGSEIQVARAFVEDSLQVVGARITLWQIISSAVAISLFVTVWGVTRFTHLGRKIRAVASDPELAIVVGINRESILLSTMCAGSALAGVSGFLIAYETAITPTGSFRILLVGITAAIVGGLGSVWGAMLGGVLIGVTQHFGTWKLPAQWQDAIVFIILILFLLFRPQGFGGKRLRKSSI